MAFGRRFSYNYERYSAKDIVQFLEHTLSFQTAYYNKEKRGMGHGFTITGTPIDIRIPDVAYIEELRFDPMVKYLGDVHWNTFDHMYYSEESIKKHTYDEKDMHKFKEHEKIFNSLKRKFQMRPEEQPRAVKDRDWILKLKRQSKRKSWFHL